MAIDVYKEWLGIPEGERPPNHYELLRLVQFEDDTEKIRAHYKKLNAHVRKYATGQYSVQSQELLNELAKAMLCLTDPERKREYDESLGREFEEELSETGGKPLEKVLQEWGHLDRNQVKEVQQFADKRGLSMRDAVVQMKLVDSSTAARALSEELGLSYINLEDTWPDDSVLDRVPRNLVKRNAVLPLFVEEDVVLVACSDEPSHELEDEMRLRFGVPMRPVIAEPRSINQSIAKYYAPGVRDEAVAEQAAAGATKKQAAKKAAAKQPKKARSQSTPEEVRQQKLLGVIIICWGIIGAFLLDQFVVSSLIGSNNPFLSYLTMIIVSPAVIAYVVLVYWKK